MRFFGFADKADRRARKPCTAETREGTTATQDLAKSLEEQFFARLSAKYCSPGFSLYPPDLIMSHPLLSHPHSDLMFDGDSRTKFYFSSEPVRAYWGAPVASMLCRLDLAS